MAVLTRGQVIHRPIDEVFAVIVDGGNFAAWNPTIRASRQLDDGEIGAGTRFEWDLRGFGKVVQELQDFDRPTQVRIVPHTKMLEGGHRFRLTAQGDATRVDHELEMHPRAVEAVRADDRDDRPQEPPRHGERAPGPPREVASGRVPRDGPDPRVRSIPTTLTRTSS